MKLKKDKKIEEIKMKLWCDVYKGVATLWNSEWKKSGDSVPKKWADQAIEDFNKSFKIINK